MKDEKKHQYDLEYSEADKKIADLKKQNQRQLATERTKGSAQIGKVRTEYDAEVARVHKDGDRELSYQKQTYDQRTQQQKASYQDKLEQMHKQHEHEIANATEGHQKRMEENQRVQRKDLAKQKSEFEKASIKINLLTGKPLKINASASLIRYKKKNKKSWKATANILTKIMTRFIACRIRKQNSLTEPLTMKFEPGYPNTKPTTLIYESKKIMWSSAAAGGLTTL